MSSESSGPSFLHRCPLTTDWNGCGSHPGDGGRPGTDGWVDEGETAQGVPDTQVLDPNAAHPSAIWSQLQPTLKAGPKKVDRDQSLLPKVKKRARAAREQSKVSSEVRDDLKTTKEVKEPGGLEVRNTPANR